MGMLKQEKKAARYID